MCPTIAEMGVRLWHVSSWCARWRILRCRGFAAISQLRNECTGLPNGIRVPKSGFAATKYSSKWSFGCEIGIFHVLGLRSHFAAAKWESLCCEMALVCQIWFRSCKILCGMELWLQNQEFSRFVASQSFRSCEMGVTMLLNGTRVLKLVSQLQKFSQRGAWGCKMVSQQSVDFAEAAKSHRSLFLPCFCSVFAPIFAPISLRKTSFNFFAIPPDFDHPKTYITSKQIRIKALKSKLKQVISKTKRYGLASL